MPKVLIADELSPKALDIFRSRGVEVDVRIGLKKTDLLNIIGGYDGLAVRSATKADKEGVALDAASYRSAPPGLRLWCGATVEQGDVQSLTPWLDWAFDSCLALLKTG